MADRADEQDDGSGGEPTASTKRRKRRAKSPRPENAQGKGRRPVPGRTFPKIPLERAIGVAKAIEEKNASKPVRAADLAKMVGFRQPNDWRFLDLLRAANAYGLVDGTGKTATVSLTALGQDIVAPSSPSQRQQALIAAFHNVEVFKRVAEYYGGKRFPENEFFANTLIRDFGIERERVAEFIEVSRSTSTT